MVEEDIYSNVALICCNWRRCLKYLSSSSVITLTLHNREGFYVCKINNLNIVHCCKIPEKENVVYDKINTIYYVHNTNIFKHFYRNSAIQITWGLCATTS